MQEEILKDSRFVKIINAVKKIKKSKLVIKIDGRGGSGKSTIAKLLSEDLPNSIYINLDEYIISYNDLFEQRNIDRNFDINFENIIYYEKKLQSIIDNSNVHYIILEGCFSFKNTQSINGDYKIWINISKEMASNRLNQREKDDPNRVGLPYETIELATSMWQLSEDRYIKEFKPKKNADIILNQ